ncbi:MAG: calcium-translocating P-type ATPase, PMCA-type [Prevotellaceae bacterium]|jgi:Ca2+-transporting ATPase|nr:calcium-translocating P-type ATPase, PMCA-type [Prevotellaceae bacterium]
MEHKNHYTGLYGEQVLESRRLHGENILTPPQKESLWSQLIEKFADPIIRILLIALLASVGVACYQFYTATQDESVFLEPLGILVAILLATCVSFAFEVSANKKFKMLSQVNDDTPVKVVRSGNVCEIPKREVVVGDVVILETGEEIPADGKLLEAISLQVNESTLTGEPVANKTTNPENFSKDATYSSNVVMKGTVVVDGHGVMEVQKVGDDTEQGKVYEGSQIDNKVETPLNRQLNRLGDLITYASYAVAGAIIAARLLLYFTGAEAENISWINAGSYILNTIMIAVTVIVVAVPEGLPMSVTLSLALSMKRMFSANNLVRKMHACETMGAATVICTDKTGTLTQNQMRVFEANFYGYDGAGLKASKTGKIIAEAIALNSTAHLDFSDAAKIRALGNPTEGALLLWLHDNAVSYLSLRETVEIVEQLTFSTERKYMATVAKSAATGKNMLYVKGAPEIVLAHCANVLAAGKRTPVAEYRATIETQLLGYQQQAMRTLAFACKELGDGERGFAEGKLTTANLDCLGIVAISDPVRKDAPAAVAACLKAGIDVKIVTGDTPGTAKEIARQIGLWGSNDGDDRHITGAEFAELPDETLLNRVLSLKIMSRARPMDKERLVRLLQQKNQVVAVTGDGANDAPALNAAQVGLSMGDGTSVAKEASAITILDNSFKSITRAVMWGRSLYQNIQRFILFQMTINVAACLIVLTGSFLGTESPLTVTQMLWVNLIMDTFAALALASLPPNERVMRRKPRNATEHIITKKMATAILGTGVTFLAVLFGILQYFKHNDVTSLTQLNARSFLASYFDFSGGNGLSPYELSLFFTIFVLLQFWNMFNAKAFGSGRSAFFELHKRLSGFVAVAFIIMAGQFVIVTIGGEMFNVVPLRPTDWGIIAGATSLTLWIGEAARLLRRRKIEV